MDSFIEENFSKSILTLTVCINPQTYNKGGGGGSHKVFQIFFPTR